MSFFQSSHSLQSRGMTVSFASCVLHFVLKDTLFWFGFWPFGVFGFLAMSLIKFQRHVHKVERISSSIPCWIHHRDLLNVCRLQPNNFFRVQNLVT